MSFHPSAEYRILIMKYLTHSVDAKEEHELRHWVDQHPDHAAYFENLYEVWDRLHALPQAAPPRVDEAWKRFSTFLPDMEEATLSGNRVSFFSLRLALVTMLLAVGLGVAGWYVFKSEKIVPFELQDRVPGLVYLQGDTVFAYVNGGIIPVGETSDDYFSIQGKDKIDPFLSVFVEKDSMGRRWKISVKQGHAFLQTPSERLQINDEKAAFYFPESGEIFIQRKVE